MTDTSPLNVLHVAGNYPIPPLGGMEAVTYFLPQELARQGHRVRVYGGSPTPRHDVVSGAEFRGLPAFRFSNWVRVPSWSAYRFLLQGLEWAEVVHIHNPPEVIPLLGGRAALREGKPVVYSVLSPGTLRRHPSLPYRAFGSVDELLVTHQLRRATAVQVKNSLDEVAMKGLNDRVRLIPDGIETGFFVPAPGPSTFLEDHGRVGREPFLLYVGRIHPLKGVSDFVRMAGLLRRDHPHLLASVVGPGTPEETAQLRSTIQREGLEGTVEYVGTVTTEEKIRAIDAATVVVVPSQSDFVEGFSIISSEAWARRKPVAAYPVGALKVRVQNGVNGYLADRVDPKALATAVTKCLSLTVQEVPRDVMPWSEVAREFGTLYRGGP